MKNQKLSVAFQFVLAFFSLALISANIALGQISKNPVGISYCYPSPNAAHVSPKTTIGVRFKQAIDRSSFKDNTFSVIGISSRSHTGKLTLALDGRTIIFSPDRFFSYGEKVVVTIPSLECISGDSTIPYSFIFYISRSKIIPNSLRAREGGTAGGALSETNINTFQPWVAASRSTADTLPDDFPKIYITKNENPAPGNLFLADFRFTGNDSGTYLINMDNGGNILFKRSTWPAFAQDFRPQQNGTFTYYDADPAKSKFYELDSNYTIRDSFEAQNGYGTDSHELIFLPGGGYALLAQNEETVNMNLIVSNGDSGVSVIEGILQEFDANKNLIFEWRSREHFAFSDPTHENFAQPFLDFTHCNSIDYDFDSTFLLSSRNLDEVTKIDRESGNVIWRWGGKNNQFTFVNDSLIFSHQHAVHRLPNGNIVMFDNGNFHPTAQPFSRAVEYKLDESAKIATKVWEYHHDPDVFGSAMGYVQQLGNGNRLIGWGACDSVAVTEIKPDGTTALEVKFEPGIYSYRAYKFTKDQLTAGVTPQNRVSNISLEQNYPNPLSTTSTINFSTDIWVPIVLSVYDILGREIKTLFNGTVDPGNYSAKFEAGNLANGIYICKLTSPATIVSRTMIIAK